MLVFLGVKVNANMQGYILMHASCYAHARICGAARVPACGPLLRNPIKVHHLPYSAYVRGYIQVAESESTCGSPVCPALSQDPRSCIHGPSSGILAKDYCMSAYLRG
jgi:hypothetical protein